MAEAEGRNLRAHRDFHFPRQADHRLRAGGSGRQRGNGRRDHGRGRSGAAAAGAAAAAEERTRLDAAVRGGRGAGMQPPPNPNGSGVFRSEDGGKTWTFVSNQNQRPTYFSQIRVDPVNDQKLLRGRQSRRRCRSMAARRGRAWNGSHTDYHAFWINPKDPRIVVVGHDGGVDFSYDGGFTWDYHNDIAVGQFYQVSADMRRPYYVCGGLQDNNAWCGPSAVRSNNGPVNTDWFTVAGGDGFYTRQDPTDWAIGVRRIAGRQHDPSRSADRHAEEHPADGGSLARPRDPLRRRRMRFNRASNPPAGQLPRSGDGSGCAGRPGAADAEAAVVRRT